MGQDPLSLQRVYVSSMIGVIHSLARPSDLARQQGEARKGALTWEYGVFGIYLAFSRCLFSPHRYRLYARGSGGAISTNYVSTKELFSTPMGEEAKNRS